MRVVADEIEIVRQAVVRHRLLEGLLGLLGSVQNEFLSRPVSQLLEDGLERREGGAGLNIESPCTKEKVKVIAKEKRTSSSLGREPIRADSKSATPASNSCDDPTKPAQAPIRSQLQRQAKSVSNEDDVVNTPETQTGRANSTGRG